MRKSLFATLALAAATTLVCSLPTPSVAQSTCNTSLGQLSTNRYGSESVSNPYSFAGSQYSSTGVNNPYSAYGSPCSSKSATNPYATNAPKIVANDGTYLGRASANNYDPESTSNPYGKYGSQYSSTSVNNPYSVYGSKYSSQSANSPYTTTAPKLYGCK